MKFLQLLAKNFSKIAISVYSVTVINFLFLVTAQPTLADPKNLEYLKILHPTIIPEWLSRGKFQFCQL